MDGISSKRSNIKWMKPVGIVAIAWGALQFVALLLLGMTEVIDEDKTNVTHIEGDNGSATIITHGSINWENLLAIIGLIIFLAAGVTLLILHSIWKDNSVKIEGSTISGKSDKKDFSFDFEALESCTANGSVLNLKKKSDAKPISVYMIANAGEIAEFIRKKKEGEASPQSK